MNATPSPDSPRTAPTPRRGPDRRAALIGGIAGGSGAVLAVALIVFFAMRAGA
ncbi:hypothetical protein [Cellulomonas sp. NPDC058312]|uniref:hypothetical protein n=1 Tax=Cellulomonas sp. NPDC058312 TaxID=3346441 RepID=UPI0036E773F8